MKIKFDTATNVQRSLAYISNKVLSGEMPEKRANCLIYACNAALSAIRESKQEMPGEHYEKAREILDAVPSVIDREDSTK